MSDSLGPAGTALRQTFIPVWLEGNIPVNTGALLSPPLYVTVQVTELLCISVTVK